MYYIDKTECLEKGIVVFPSIYIMGASATGKSTLVEMFLKKHPEVKSLTIAMEKVLRCSETEHKSRNVSKCDTERRWKCGSDIG